MSILKNARKLFGGDDSKKEKPSRKTKKPATTGSATEISKETSAKELAQLERQLTKMSKGRTELVAGRVQLINFDKLREKLGDQWERLADRIQRVIQLAVKRRLTEQDIFLRHGELGYLIVFARLGPKEAALKCALIADEVSKRLLGNNISSEDIEVRTATATVSGKIELRRADGIDLLLNEISGLLESPTQRVSETESEPNRSAIDSPETIKPGPNSELDYIKTQPFSASNLDYVFQPMWDLSKRVISTFICIPARRGGSGKLIVGEAAIPNELKPQEIFDLDITVLRNALSELLSALNDGRKFLVAAPVHYETLASAQRRQRYLADCRNLSDLGRKFLLFEIIDLPEGVMQSRLTELSVALKPFSRAVLARCSVDETDFAKYKWSGVIAVGFDASPLTASEARLMQAMENFVERSEKAGLQTFVYGLNSLSLNTAAIATGVTYICGHTLTSISEHPQNAIRFNLNDLFGIPAL